MPEVTIITTGTNTGDPGNDPGASHPPLDAEASAPDPLPAVTGAVMAGMAIGERTGLAEAAAVDASQRAADAEARATAAESEATTLRERVASLEAALTAATTPPEPELTEAATVVAVADVTPAPATDQTPAPAKPRGWMMRILLG